MNNLEKSSTWDIYDSSRVQGFQTCARMDFFRSILGWTSNFPNNHLVFGSAVHLAMKHLLLHGYGNDSILKAFELFRNYYRKEFPEETDELYTPKIPSRVLPALIEYCQTYARDFEEFEPLYVEVGGTVPLTDDVVMHFRQDAICKKPNGEIFSMEHKTLGRTPSRQWTEQWDLKTQIGTYTHALYCMFPQEDVFGVTVNALGFLKTKFAFLRQPIRKTEEIMQAWLWNTLYWIDQIKWNTAFLMNDCSPSDQVMMAFPMNTESCTKYFGCPYKDFCASWPNPLQHCDEPPMGFKIEWWNPLDEEPDNLVEGGKLIEKEVIK